MGCKPCQEAWKLTEFEGLGLGFSYSRERSSEEQLVDEWDEARRSRSGEGLRAQRHALEVPQA